MKPAAPSPSPGERFLKAFCEIEEYLRQLTNQPHETQFIVLLKKLVAVPALSPGDMKTWTSYGICGTPLSTTDAA